MKCSELIEILNDAINKFGDDVPVMFDTAARTFEYHMARIGSAYVNQGPEPHVSLHEDNK